MPLPLHHQKQVGKKGLLELERVYLTSFLRASFKTTFPTPLVCSTMVIGIHLLQATQSVLLINVPVPLLLLSPVEHHGDAEDQDGVEADDAESCREDKVEIPVRERREWADAAALLRGHERVDADAVLYKGRGGRVKVSAAIKLSSVSAVFGIASASGMQCGGCRPSLNTC